MHRTLPLILGMILLGGAAAPPTGCQTAGPPGQTYPRPSDLTGRPAGSDALASGEVVPTPDAAMPCHMPASALQNNTPAGEASDAIHGLPAPDILRPIADPMAHPAFR